MLSEAIDDSAKSSAAQADALVRWTRWYVFATVAILAVTGAGVVVNALAALHILK